MNYKTFIEWGYGLKNLCRLRRVLSTKAELFLLKTGRLEQSLVFLKKSWNLQSNFPDLERVCKVEMKSGKMVKSRSFFSRVQILFNFARNQEIQLQWLTEREVAELCYVSYCIVVTVRLQCIVRRACTFLRFLRSLLGSLETTQKARVALGCALSYSYASFVLSKLPACSVSWQTHADAWTNC